MQTRSFACGYVAEPPDPASAFDTINAALGYAQGYIQVLCPSISPRHPSHFKVANAVGASGCAFAAPTVGEIRTYHVPLGHVYISRKERQHDETEPCDWQVREI